MLPAVAVTLSADDRQRALTAAAEAANPDRGREVFVQTLAIAAFQQLWSWLEFGPDCSVIDGLPGEVGRVGLAQGGSIALLPLIPDATDPVEVGQPPDLTVDWPLDWPLDWPDDVVAFVPVAVSRSLDRAWLWGWVSVGDLHLPPAPAQPPLRAVLQDWEFLEPYLWRMEVALAWIAEAVDPVAQQVRQAIAPDQRMALVASLDHQYREDDLMSGLDFGLSAFSLDDEEESLECDPSEDALLADRSRSESDDASLADSFSPDLFSPDLLLNDSPLTYRYAVDRPTAQVRDAANPYRTKPYDLNASQSPSRDWQHLSALLLERLLPIWDHQNDRPSIYADPPFHHDHLDRPPSDEAAENDDG